MVTNLAGMGNHSVSAPRSGIVLFTQISECGRQRSHARSETGFDIPLGIAYEEAMARLDAHCPAGV